MADAAARRLYGIMPDKGNIMKDTDHIPVEVTSLFGVNCRSDTEGRSWSQHVLAPSMSDALDKALELKPYTKGDAIVIVELDVVSA